MTWEDAVDTLRNDPSRASLVEDAYLSDDLLQNVEKFQSSIEFGETLRIIKENFDSNVNNLQILDIGAGNGIASLSFALCGFNVTAIEPNPSLSVGNGAIQKLKASFNLSNLSIVEGFMEDLDLPENSFDLIYGRQVMHHAYDLRRFTKNCYRLLRPNGILLTVRDHVIKNQSDKEAFLKNHPLHKLYGGENAFTLNEYKEALSISGFKIKHLWSASKSPLNFSPWSDKRIREFLAKNLRKLSPFFPMALARFFLFVYLEHVPGRLYSFLCTK